MARILVVDDEISIRTLLDTILRRKGHEILLADRGTKALEMYACEQPEVVILDPFMPGRNGIVVLEQLRAMAPQLPVIIITGMGNDASKQRAQELGVTEFLVKGVSLHRLGEALAKALKPADVRDAKGITFSTDAQRSTCVMVLPYRHGLGASNATHSHCR